VTYVLQIADKEDFSSLKLQIKDISITSYTVTEKLKSGKHYWRVKAVDGAGNTAGWTGAFSFVEKKGEAGSCGCGSGARTSTSELWVGLGIIGFWWGTGLYLLSRAKKRRDTRN